MADLCGAQILRQQTNKQTKKLLCTNTNTRGTNKRKLRI